jgi:hypothetical protein
MLYHMKNKTCSNCHKNKKVSEFNWKNKVRGWYNSLCKSCHSEYRKTHYLANRKIYLKKARKWNKKQTIFLREFIYSYLSEHCCVDCGNKDIRTLDFDHEFDKKMGISLMVRNCHSVESIKKEISKCKVRCANCHRIKTFQRGKYWKEKMGA